jgi:hypothetical protein
MGGTVGMKRPTVDEQVDAAIARAGNDPVFVATTPPEWLAPFEQNLPFRLPPTYRSLLLRYRFPAFQVGKVELFGNLDGESYDDLVVASTRDRVLSSVARSGGFIHIGRPETRNYDPICFDFRRRTKTGEATIVRLDHEEILCNDSVRVVEAIAPSFLELLERGIRFMEQ